MLKGKLEFSGEFFANLFKPQTPPLIGVDITSSSVKMVELSEVSKGRIRLDRYAIEPLPKDAVVDGNIMNLEAVGEAVRRGWKRMGTRIKNLAMALPSAQVITKKITVPAGLREDELETQVETEANQYIPFALEEVNLDFQSLGPSPNNPEDIEVLIAASRREKVEDRVAVAEFGGLKAIVMDIDSFAAQTAFELMEVQLPEGGREQLIVLVDVGASMMNINVLRNDQSVYMREQPFGGNQLTQEIQRHFNLSAEEAEAAKRNGGLPDTYDNEVLQPFMDTLALEITRALQFFYTSTQYNQVNHIFLSGGCATLPGLDQVVARRTEVNTIIANPFANMQVSPKIKQRQLIQDAPALVVACGLAMRRFDA
ncbi:MAG TPA: pilus assembly protein PilM [Burkholderiales bacterium]|nr:pilus assembly protein PilM [Burkholderiales bacterium]